MTFLIFSEQEKRMDKTSRSFCSFLSVNNILCNLAEKDGKAVLEKLIAMLQRHFPELDMDYTRHEIESREALYPTMIAPGLAIPHARIPGLDQALTAMACIPGGCDFGGSEPAKVMILLLSPVNNPNLHMQILAALAAEFQAAEFTDKIARLASPQEVYNYFDRRGTVIPDYLRARDLMEAFPVMLQENNTLMTAVKLFALNRCEELPVVDNTGDLRGMLALADLLKYSLPEHLLWMEDLSPIYQLQPFSDMLKTADETKVADVMREEFISAPADAPAVELAKIFLKERLSQLVIVDQAGKPAGVVTLKNFSAKLFWD